MRDTGTRWAQELAGRWNPDANTRPPEGGTSIVFSAGAMRAWVPMLHGVIAQVLQLYDAADREKVLYRPVFPRTCKKEPKLLSFLEPGRPKYSSHSCLNMSLHSQL